MLRDEAELAEEQHSGSRISRQACVCKEVVRRVDAWKVAGCCWVTELRLWPEQSVRPMTWVYAQLAALQDDTQSLPPQRSQGGFDAALAAELDVTLSCAT